MSSAWGQARNLLCVRLDALGDVLMTTPALRALKESAPRRRLTLLTSPSGAAAARLSPEIDEVLVYEAPWLKATAPRANPIADLGMIERLRGFDAAVVFTVYSQNPLPSALLCYLAGIPLRLAHCRENPYQLLTDWIAETEPERGVRHEVRRQLDLVAHIGAQTQDERLSLHFSTASLERARDRLRHHGLEFERPWIAVHAGSTAPSRRYPPEHFASALALMPEIQPVFTGTRSEAALIEFIRAQIPQASFSLAEDAPLEEFAATLALSPLLLSNNTGAVHVAAAVGTPVVDLYALTNPQHTPWLVPQRVLFEDVECRYCYKSVCPAGHHDCLRRLAPERVAQAVRSLLTETISRRRLACTRSESTLPFTIPPPA